jgi:hypothetical protein
MLAGESVQELLEKLPPLVSEAKVTTPVGVVGPDAVSVTMAVQDVAWPVTTVSGEHVTTVLLPRSMTIRAAWPLLAAWLPSPP